MTPFNRSRSRWRRRVRSTSGRSSCIFPEFRVRRRSVRSSVAAPRSARYIRCRRSSSRRRLPSGSRAAVEGMARAVEAGEQLARDLGMRPFRIATKAKAIYHAGAVFASNYLVVVEAVAQRLLRHAGLSDADAWAALRPLVEGTFENLTRYEPREALTGPVVRGDTATIVRHLQSLAVDDAKLYRALGRAALELAQKQGMSEKLAEKVAAALATDLPPVIRRAVKTGTRGRARPG